MSAYELGIEGKTTDEILQKLVELIKNTDDDFLILGKDDDSEYFTISKSDVLEGGVLEEVVKNLYLFHQLIKHNGGECT